MDMYKTLKIFERYLNKNATQSLILHLSVFSISHQLDGLLPENLFLIDVPLLIQVQTSQVSMNSA
ncbi:MAG: hypothetical protein HZA08_02875 [Nitrospirae bacterium]|nr:hypothetical protein [Nitrospirota bacterium]